MIFEGALTVAEVYKWMVDLRDAYGTVNTLIKESNKPTTADAALLVTAFDVDNSLTLDETELAAWLQEGVNLTHEERMALGASKGK